LKLQIAQLEATLKADVGEKGGILDKLCDERGLCAFWVHGLQSPPRPSITVLLLLAALESSSSMQIVWKHFCSMFLFYTLMFVGIAPCRAFSL